MSTTVERALAAIRSGVQPERDDMKAAVKEYLAELTRRAPGRSVEVRVPPFAAVQAVPGSVHRRGTPSAVVETDPVTWLRLAAGDCSWSEAVADGRVRASGARSDLSEYLPLLDLG